MPSNGLSPLSGVSISNVPYKLLGELYCVCSIGGRVSTGECVGYSMRWRWRCGAVVVAVALWLCLIVVA